MQEKRLCEMTFAERGVVSCFAGLEEKHVRKLLALGVLPGAVIEILQVTPSLVIRFEHTQLALDREIAAHIYVERQKNS